ncbi:MAG: diaminopimelate decarboxylase [Patescibacteria group bacterium]
MPISKQFQDRLYPHLKQITDWFDTAAHIYDYRGIWNSGMDLVNAFACKGLGYNNFYAVKACPNPEILKIMLALGFGFDCSSIDELQRVRAIGATPEKIMFTSNNTSLAEFKEAVAHGGCILNFDDVSLIKKFIKHFPGKLAKLVVCVRYNPGKLHSSGGHVFGKPEEQKYGVTEKQFLNAYRLLRRGGAKIIGFHMMICSNNLRSSYFIKTIKIALTKVGLLKRELGIEVPFINIGGGFGIPYLPTKKCKKLDVNRIGLWAGKLFAAFGKEYGFQPALFTECGRYVTGPNGVLVCRIINRLEKYKTFFGIDSGMQDVPRPSYYGAYHHIHILTPQGNLRRGGRKFKAHISGSLCEAWDRFTPKPRLLPVSTRVGDLCVVQEDGAHTLPSGSNYNSRLQSQELFFLDDDSVIRIGRAKRPSDLHITYGCKRKTLRIGH